MSEEGQIVSNIPIPKIIRGRGKYKFSMMKVGDSFWSEATTDALRTAAYKYVNRTSKKNKDKVFKAVRIDAGGARIWRIK
ncbi:MAG: hypothetical protein A2W17_06730 [Planctomycetes bacterium RBG_16_41_13]|nr:MAG: hypothetical protein A2W17_06730 [Planctomycetes bacterium RBG_16_41_13]